MKIDAIFHSSQDQCENDQCEYDQCEYDQCEYDQCEYDQCECEYDQCECEYDQCECEYDQCEYDKWCGRYPESTMLNNPFLKSLLYRVLFWIGQKRRVTTTVPLSAL